ncbi:phosphoribosyltransferase [Chryseobacterium sp. 1B4]
MKYPIEIENKILDIDNIITKWPIKKSLEEVINWILQFDNEDFDFAFRILKNLNVIGPEELNSALSISYSKLNRQARNKQINISVKNTMFASIGGASKSGAMISYNFRLINELASANFLDDESIKYIENGKIENLVLVDDIIGTGEQSSNELKNIAERVLPLGVKNIFILTAIGFKTGIKKVEEIQLADVFSALEYDDDDTVLSLDSAFYDGLSYSERKEYFEKFSKYKGLGYKGAGTLIAFYYNTPNTTINSIWHQAHGWIPLFPRISNTTGIDKHYPELEAALKKSKNIDTLTIYVEGKTEELFFELIGGKFNNFGYKALDVISVGLFYSEKLIKSLVSISPNYLFIAEKNIRQQVAARKVIDSIDQDKILYIHDIVEYFDTTKIVDSGRFNLKVDDIENIAEYISLKFFRRVPPTIREKNILIMVNDFLDDNKILGLVDEIKNKLKIQ